VAKKKTRKQTARPALELQVGADSLSSRTRLFFVRYRTEIVVCLFLVIATAAVYWNVSSHQFLNLDDDLYVYENPTVRAGLTAHGIAWAFSTFHTANWHPLTWLSHMMDAQLFGLNAGRILYVNVALHILNSVLLFLALRRMTGAVWRSAFVAALFALHPLHVESVAWVSERKDVLSSFFFMLTLYAYASYVERPKSWGRYLLVIAGLAMGLMAKPMLVTVPFVLLLLDYWPLHRLKWEPAEGVKALLRNALPLVREKIPLFVLVACSCAVTYVAQQRGGAVKTLIRFPLQARLSNVVAAYAVYINKMIWPRDLAVYYPYEQSRPGFQLLMSAFLLLSVSVLALYAARRHKYFFTGWLWFLGMLVPVIGFVQVGEQALADRYTYLPLIGLFLLITWGAADLTKEWRYRRLAAGLAAAAIVAMFSVLTWRQVKYWQDNETLYGHTLAVTSDNYVIETNLGYALSKSGRRAEGIAHLNEALRVQPYFFEAHNSLGAALTEEKRLNEAIEHFQIALRLNPESAKAQSNMGAALGMSGKFDEAIFHLKEALRLDPTYPNTSFNLGIILLRQGKNDEALRQLAECVRLQPESAETHNAYGFALNAQGHLAEAIEQFKIAVKLSPNYKQAQINLQAAEARFNQQQQ
jgi:tetratricopeptide (TPR) repeat protein